MIKILREPEGTTMDFYKSGTVLKLLNHLGETRTSVLVIRNGELLTPDRRLHPGDTIVVRSVRSSG
jgi:sulfur carrier protein